MIKLIPKTQLHITKGEHMQKKNDRDDIIRTFRRFARMGFNDHNYNPIQTYKRIEMFCTSQRSKLDMLAVFDTLRLLRLRTKPCSASTGFIFQTPPKDYPGKKWRDRSKNAPLSFSATKEQSTADLRRRESSMRKSAPASDLLTIDRLYDDFCRNMDKTIM